MLFDSHDDEGISYTPVLPVGSRVLPQAAMLTKGSAGMDSTGGRMGGLDVHERVIDRDDKDLTGIFRLGMGDVAWNMCRRARRALLLCELQVRAVERFLS